MFTELERSYLVALAKRCKSNGLTREEAEQSIRKDTGAFCNARRVQQAVHTVFAGDAKR